MPVLDFNIIDTSAQITRPVVQAVVTQIMKATGIPDNTELLLYSRDDRVNTQGSTIDNKNRDVRLIGKRRLRVKYVEEYKKENIVNIKPDVQCIRISLLTAI